jgi:oligoribonuclease NrnB/cAMP/cGMP phosphodiesterase (DHH superfamily)
MATRAEKIVEQLAIWGRGDRKLVKIDKLVEESVKFINDNRGKFEDDKCDWCGKTTGKMKRVLIHDECFEAILNGEGMI